MKEHNLRRSFVRGFGATFGVAFGLFTVGAIAGFMNEVMNRSNPEAVKDAERIVSDLFRKWFE